MESRKKISREIQEGDHKSVGIQEADPESIPEEVPRGIPEIEFGGFTEGFSR